MSSRIHRLIYAGAAVMLLARLSSGCAVKDKAPWWLPHANSETLAESGEDHGERVRRSAKIDQAALNEDLDIWFQTDRPTRLTRWHSK